MMTRSTSATWRSSPRSVTSWPLTLTRTSYWDSSARTCSSCLPGSARWLRSGGRTRRRVTVAASVNERAVLHGPTISWRAPASFLGWQVELDVQLLEPPGIHRRGRLHQEILCLLVHRKRDDLADVG